MKILKSKYFYISLLVGLIFIFIIQNVRPISVNFLFWNLIEVNFLVFVFFFFAIGVGTGLILASKYKKKSAV